METHLSTSVNFKRGLKNNYIRILQPSGALSQTLSIPKKTPREGGSKPVARGFERTRDTPGYFRDDTEIDPGGGSHRRPRGCNQNAFYHPCRGEFQIFRRLSGGIGCASPPDTTLTPSGVVM